MSYQNNIFKTVNTLLKITGILLIISGIYTLITRQFLLPIDFIPKPFDFLNYPSIFTVIPSGIIIILSLNSKKLTFKKSDLEVTLSTLGMLFCSVFGWEAIFHYAFPVYLNYFKFPFINFQESNIYLPVGIFLAGFIAYQYKQGSLYMNKYAKICFILFIVLFAFWILNGFPQFYKLGVVYYPDVVNIGLKDSYSGILFLNYLDKILFTLIFIFLMVDAKFGSSMSSLISSYRNEKTIRLLVMVSLAGYLILSYPGFEPLTGITVSAVAAISAAYFGVTPVSHQNHIFLNLNNGISIIDISPECSGVAVIVLFIVVLFMVPGIALKHRFSSFLFIPLIYAANLFRIVSAVVVGDNAGIETLLWYHRIGGQIILLIAIMISYILFLKLFGYFNNNKVNTTLGKDNEAN